MLVSPFKIAYSFEKGQKQKLYKLIEKSPKYPVEDFKFQLLPYLPDEEAHSFTTVIIGKNNDDNYKKKILTFYSKDGEILRRIISTSDTSTILRDYAVKSGSVDKKSISKIRKIVTKFLDKNDFLFKLRSVEEQKTYKNLEAGKTKLQINKNVVYGDNIKASVTEYPWVKSEIDNPSKKEIKLDMYLENGVPKIVDVSTQNVSLPKDDKYLPFRFIFDNSLKRVGFAKFMLKEKGLSCLNTAVKISNKLRSDVAAYFSEFENMLVFNPESQNDSIKLAAHEVQHAYHFAQIGRLGKGSSKYCQKSRNLLGEISDPAEKQQALKYFVAAEKYPNIDSKGSLMQDSDYVNNFLECDANKEAQKVYDDYKKSGEFLSSQFCFGDI